MSVDPEDPGEDDHAHEMLAAAEQNFRSVMRALADIRTRLEAGDLDLPETEIRRSLTSVHRAVQVVFDERRKLDDIRRSQNKAVRDHALDIRRAEREVRLRLARIRATLEGDGVSERPE